jgi:predicted HTH transcriptional regulator
MNTQWNQAKLQQYIDDATEESLTLEYKAATSLSRTDKYKTEITKDVSSMANSAGGIIIYGLKEFNDDDKKHLPEKIDPINRREFSKEWLEQNINNIRPHIDGIIITPIIPSP